MTIQGPFNALLNQRKVKFKNLYRDSFKLLRQDVTNEVNIFWNLVTLIRRFQKPDMIESILNMSKLQKYALSAEILNWCAHYRHYFWSRHGIHTTFYLYYTFKTPSKKQAIDPLYEQTYFDDLSLSHPVLGELNNILFENFKLSSIIGEYLPHIYLFDTDDCDTFNIPYMFIDQLRKSNPKCSNLIFSPHLIDYQCLKYPYTRILEWTTGNQYSKKNFVEFIKAKHKWKNEAEIKLNHLPLVVSYCGDPKFGITPVRTRKGIYYATQDIMQWSNDGFIQDMEYTNVDSLSAQMFEKEEESIRFKNNFKLISGTYAQSFLSHRANLHMREKFVDKEDNETIMSLNQKYFPYNNIQLIELMEGEYRILNSKMIRL